MTAVIALPFDDLTLHQLHAMLKLRQDVFVVEQECLIDDIDGLDLDAIHILAGWQAPDRLLGTARLRGPTPAKEAARIGRVATAPAQRGSGIGGAMMRFAIDECTRRWGPVPIELSAQRHAEAFYARLGFITVSDEYDDGYGVPHVDMRRSGVS